jgi:hypothetical protein
MATFSYPLRCYQSGCGRPAVYKIASRWSDGLTGELKTYGLCCDHCLPIWYARGVQRHRNCKLAPGETLEPPGIFQLAVRQRDRQLTRLTDLEARLNGPPTAGPPNAASVGEPHPLQE